MKLERGIGKKWERWKEKKITEIEKERRKTWREKEDLKKNEKKKISEREIGKELNKKLILIF